MRAQRMLRRVGTLRHRRLVERNDDAYLMSSPENARRLMASMRDALEGRYTLTTPDGLRASLFGRSDRDDTTHLLSSPENGKRLMDAVRRVNEGKARPTTLEEIRARLGLA